MDTNSQKLSGFLGLSAELRVQVYQHAILSGLRCANTDGVIALSRTCHLIYDELSEILRKPRLEPFIQGSRVHNPNFFLLMSAELTYGIFLAEEEGACAKVILQPYWSFNEQRPSYLSMNFLNVPQFEGMSHLAPALQRILSLPWHTLIIEYYDKWEPTLPTDHYHRIYRDLSRHLDTSNLLHSTQRFVCHIGTQGSRPYSPSRAGSARGDEAQDLLRCLRGMPSFPFEVCWACRTSDQDSLSAWHLVYDPNVDLPMPDNARLCFVWTDNEAAYKAKWSHTLYYRSTPWGESRSRSVYFVD
jgi:hypothetical protein